jgi:predicted nucleic acid-binding protein
MNGFLLDTNVPSELIRVRPEPSVAAWLEAADDQQLFVSVVTIGELRKGFTILPRSKRRAFLEDWLRDELLPWFAGRILPVTQTIADRWGTSTESLNCEVRRLTPPTA